MAGIRRTALIGAGTMAGVGVGSLAWSALAEPRLFALRRLDLPVLPPASWPIRVLHLSDLHIVPGQQR